MYLVGSLEGVAPGFGFKGFRGSMGMFPIGSL